MNYKNRQMKGRPKMRNKGEVYMEREKQLIFYHPITKTFRVWDWETVKWVDAQYYAPKMFTKER